VVPDIDIWRAGNLMLKRYGARARAKAFTPEREG
jgi:hypothetical protein